MWKLEFEAVDESRLPFFVGLSGKLEQSVRKREDYSKRKRKVYPSLEEKAANLLYFMIKDHPYADGCKRIAASLFLEFLARNNALYRDDNKIISDGALVAITLMIAESRPEEKDIMVNLVMNFLTM